MDGFLSEETQALVPLLAAFDAVATNGHVTRGADVLAVPQSSVSRRLQNLEKTLGVSLFTPSGRRVVLTPQGRDLLSRIRGPLHALDDAINTVRVDADFDTGLVRFGFPLTLGPISVPSLLAAFHEEAPGIRLHLTQAHGAELSRALKEGELDLAILIPAPTGLPAVQLGTQALRLHVSRQHPLAHRKRVSLAELENEAFIANPPTYHLRQSLEKWCTEAGFTPQVAFDITEFDTLRALVVRNLGIAILPSGETTLPGLVDIHLSGGPYERSVVLAAAPTPLTPAARRLHEHILARAEL